MISLGNIKWAQDLLRPASEISQPETTTTQQQHNTFTPQAGTRELANGSGSRSRTATEEPRHGLRTGSGPAAGELGTTTIAPAARSPSGSSRLSGRSSSSGSGRGSRRKRESGPGPGLCGKQLPFTPPVVAPPLGYPPHGHDNNLFMNKTVNCPKLTQSAGPARGGAYNPSSPSRSAWYCARRACFGGRSLEPQVYRIRAARASLFFSLSSSGPRAPSIYRCRYRPHTMRRDCGRAA